MKIHHRDNPTFSLAFLMWLSAALFYFYENLIQVSPNAMSQMLMTSFGINATLLGTMQTIYYSIYSGMQIPVGILIDRFGVRYCLTFAAAICALGVFTFASAPHIGGALIARGFIALGSAFAAISCLTIASMWFKDRAFSLLTGSLLSIGFTGSIIGVRCIDWIIQVSQSWQSAMKWLALLGLLIALLVWWVVRQKPIAKTQSDLTGLGDIFRNRTAWKIAGYGALMFTPTLIFAAEWGVSYFVTTKTITNVAAQNLIMNLLIGFIIGAPLIGAAAKVVSRIKTILISAAALCLICVMAILYGQYSHPVIYSILMFLFGFFSSGFLPAFTLIKLTSPSQHTGAAFGMMNTLNMLGAALAGPLIGHILDTYPHNVSETGVQLYAPIAYQNAFILLPISLVCALIIACLLPTINVQGAIHE